MTDDLRQYQETAKNHLSTAFAQAGGSLECERDVLVFNPAAKSVWYDYRDECERMGAAGGEYDHVFTPILRSPEMAGRIAAILHKFDGYEGNEIDEATTRRAVAVACWYRDEAVRIAGNHAPDEKYQRAQKLAEWIYSRPGDRVSVQDVYQKGTVTAFSGKRNAREAKYLLSFLAEHGYVMPDTKTEYLKRPGGISDASATPNPAKIANSANSFYIQ